MDGDGNLDVSDPPLFVPVTHFNIDGFTALPKARE
jgi:hypothetical protein